MLPDVVASPPVGRGRAAAVVLVSAVALLAVPRPAPAATLVGETFTPDTALGSFVTVVQSGSPGDRYRVPTAGILTSWSYRATSQVPVLSLRVARQTGGSSFTIVGSSFSFLPAPNQLNTFDARIAVRPGDVLGLFAEGSALIATGAGGYSYHFTTGDPQSGSGPPFAGPFSGAKLDVSATVEPDCDSDGLGDETEDPDVVLPCTADTTPPETKILHADTGRRATFKFRSSEQHDAILQCSRDGRRFKRCTSPQQYFVKPGHHSFRVFAIDAAGNVDPTPAARHWRVRRR